MKFYRYINGQGEELIFIWLNTYYLVRETKCFYIVREREYFGKEIRVPKDSNKCRNIHHSKESAWESFKIRQMRRIEHAERNIEIARKTIDYIKLNQSPDSVVYLK